MLGGALADMEGVFVGGALRANKELVKEEKSNAAELGVGILGTGVSEVETLPVDIVLNGTELGGGKLLVTLITALKD